MSYAIYIFLFVPIAVFAYLAFREAKDVNGLVGYFQYGKRLSQFQFFATLTASSAGLASTLLLIAVYGYLYGLGVFVWVIIFWWLTQWASTATIKAVERRRPGFWASRGTLHEFLGREFDSKTVRITSAMMTVVCYTLLLLAEVLLGYRLVYGAIHGGTAAAMSFPMEGGALIGYGLILLFVFGYTAYAGFRAVISTDAIQFVLIAVMIVAVTAYLGPEIPNLAAQHATIFGSDLLSSIINPVARDTPSFLLFFVTMNLLFWVAWWPVAMDQWHRCAATTSIEQATNSRLGTSGFLTRGFLLILVAAFVLIGAATRAYVGPGGELPDPIPTFFRSLMPGGALAASSPVLSVTMAGIVLMGLVAAVLSTIDTYIVVLTQSLFVDVIIAKANNATLIDADKETHLQEKYLRLARRIAFSWLIVVCLLGYAISSTTLDAFNIVYAGFAFQMAFIPVLLVALSGHARGYGTSATTALIVGGVWCSLSFPYLFLRLTTAVTAGNVGEMYHLLDLMFSNTVLVALISTIAFYLTKRLTRPTPHSL